MFLKYHLSKVLIVILLGSLLACEGDYKITYQWNGMEAVNAKNTVDYPVETADQTIEAENYVIKLKLDAEELSRKGRYLDRETAPTNVNGIKNLKITASEGWSLDYPKDSLLNDLFVGLIGNYFYAEKINQLYITSQHQHNFFDQPLVDEIDLLLVSKPQGTFTGKFYVEMMLKDGTVFIDSTNVISIQ